MDIIAAIVIGYITGYMLNLLAGWLPAQTSDAIDEPRPLMTPALRYLFADEHPPEWRLHLLAETGLALLFGLLTALDGWTGALITAMLAAAFLLLIALIDIKYRIVPNALIYPSMFVVVVLHALARTIPLSEIVVGGMFAFMIFFVVMQLRPGDLGGGDVKLAGMLGLAFGFPDILYVLLIGTGAGAVFAVGGVLARQSRKLTFPYAPFLCLGATVMLVIHVQ